MTIELVLIRHGKAEKRSSSIDDTKRELTKKGKEEFEAFISSIKEELITDTSIKVWTSPLKRATQTASILTDQMEWDKADKKDFIANGDFQTLLDEIANLNSDTRVVCVGHEPTLGDWVKELTGSSYSFKKGGIALIRLDDDEKTEGTLVWDSDPTSQKKRDKKDETLKHVLLHQVEAMDEAYKNFRRNPYSPEQSHLFRVNMRKMRSLLHFVKPLIGEETYNELNTSIRETSRRLEPLREADVLIESCGERALLEPDLIQDYFEVFRYLHNERRRWMRRRLKKGMISAYEEMLEETKRAITQLTFYEEKSKGADWDTFLEERFASRNKKVLTLYKNADYSDHEAAHDVRKQAKKLRYAAIAFEERLPSKEAKKVKKKSKAIQNELGLICDLHINSERLKAYSKIAKDPALKKSFNALAERQLSLRKEVVSDNSD